MSSEFVVFVVPGGEAGDDLNPLDIHISLTVSSQFLAMISLAMRCESASLAVKAKKLPNFGGCLPAGKIVDG